MYIHNVIILFNLIEKKGKLFVVEGMRGESLKKAC